MGRTAGRGCGEEESGSEATWLPPPLAAGGSSAGPPARSPSRWGSSVPEREPSWSPESESQSEPGSSEAQYKVH